MKQPSSRRPRGSSRSSSPCVRSGSTSNRRRAGTLRVPATPDLHLLDAGDPQQHGVHSGEVRCVRRAARYCAAGSDLPATAVGRRRGGGPDHGQGRGGDVARDPGDHGRRDDRLLHRPPLAGAGGLEGFRKPWPAAGSAAPAIWRRWPKDSKRHRSNWAWRYWRTTRSTSCGCQFLLGSKNIAERFKPLGAGRRRTGRGDGSGGGARGQGREGAEDARLSLPRGPGDDGDLDRRDRFAPKLPEFPPVFVDQRLEDLAGHHHGHPRCRSPERGRYRVRTRWRWRSSTSLSLAWEREPL